MEESFQQNGIRWKKYHGALIPLEAPDREIQLDAKEGQDLLKRSGCHLLRYTSHFDDASHDSFWYVIKDGKASMEELSSNTRSKVRRGLKHCEVERVGKEEILNNGYEVYRKAFERYGTKISPHSKEGFEKNVENLDPEEWDFWKVSAKDSGEMIAYSRNRKFDHCCDYTEIKFHPEKLGLYPSYALFQTMNEYYLNEKGWKFVNDGARSISHETNVQEFLIRKFKFRRAYCKLHLIYRPWLRTMVRLAYPFRGILSKTGAPSSLRTLLQQEALAREDADR